MFALSKRGPAPDPYDYKRNRGGFFARLFKFGEKDTDDPMVLEARTQIREMTNLLDIIKMHIGAFLQNAKGTASSSVAIAKKIQHGMLLHRDEAKKGQAPPPLQDVVLQMKEAYEFWHPELYDNMARLIQGTVLIHVNGVSVSLKLLKNSVEKAVSEQQRLESNFFDRVVKLRDSWFGRIFVEMLQSQAPFFHAIYESVKLVDVPMPATDTVDPVVKYADVPAPDEDAILDATKRSVMHTIRRKVMKRKTNRSDLSYDTAQRHLNQVAETTELLGSSIADFIAEVGEMCKSSSTLTDKIVTFFQDNGSSVDIISMANEIEKLTQLWVKLLSILKSDIERTAMVAIDKLRKTVKNFHARNDAREDLMDRMDFFEGKIAKEQEKLGKGLEVPGLAGLESNLESLEHLFREKTISIKAAIDDFYRNRFEHWEPILGAFFRAQRNFFQQLSDSLLNVHQIIQSNEDSLFDCKYAVTKAGIVEMEEESDDEGPASPSAAASPRESVAVEEVQEAEEEEEEAIDEDAEKEAKALEAQLEKEEEEARKAEEKELARQKAAEENARKAAEKAEKERLKAEAAAEKLRLKEEAAAAAAAKKEAAAAAKKEAEQKKREEEARKKEEAARKKEEAARKAADAAALAKLEKERKQREKEAAERLKKEQAEEKKRNADEKAKNEKERKAREKAERERKAEQDRRTAAAEKARIDAEATAKAARMRAEAESKMRASKRKDLSERMKKLREAHVLPAATGTKKRLPPPRPSALAKKRGAARVGSNKSGRAKSKGIGARFEKNTLTVKALDAQKKAAKSARGKKKSSGLDKIRAQFLANATKLEDNSRQFSAGYQVNRDKQKKTAALLMNVLAAGPMVPGKYGMGPKIKKNGAGGAAAAGAGGENGESALEQQLASELNEQAGELEHAQVDRVKVTRKKRRPMKKMKFTA